MLRCRSFIFRATQNQGLEQVTIRKPVQDLFTPYKNMQALSRCLSGHRRGNLLRDSNWQRDMEKLETATMHNEGGDAQQYKIALLQHAKQWKEDILIRDPETAERKYEEVKLDVGHEGPRVYSGDDELSS